MPLTSVKLLLLGTLPLNPRLDEVVEGTGIPSKRSRFSQNRDVERWAELSFPGRGSRTPPLHHRQILFSTNQIFHQIFLVSDRTERQTQ